MSFKFELSQRVHVPHYIDVQGIVVTRCDAVGGVDSRYGVDWITEIGRGSGNFSETEMLAANAPKPATPKVWQPVLSSGDLDSVLGHVRTLARKIKRKPARKSLKRKPSRKIKHKR